METMTIPPQLMKQADPYVSAFERFEQDRSGEASWLMHLRKGGIARFSETGFPSLRDEDWRFTNVAPITKLPFNPVLEPTHDGAIDVKHYNFANLDCTRLVFVNGHFAPKLSTILPQPKGVQIDSLARDLEAGAPLVQKHLGRHARIEQNAFAALNTAFFVDGAYIHVPPGQTVQKPVHLLFVTTSAEAGATAHPRNLIIAEHDSRLTLIES